MGFYMPLKGIIWGSFLPYFGKWAEILVRIFGGNNRTVLRAYFGGKRITYFPPCLVDEFPVERDIERFHTPRRFHPVPPGIGRTFKRKLKRGGNPGRLT